MTVCHSEVPVSKIALVIPMCMWTNIMSCTLLKTIHYKILKLTDKSSKEGGKKLSQQSTIKYSGKKICFKNPSLPNKANENCYKKIKTILQFTKMPCPFKTHGTPQYP